MTGILDRLTTERLAILVELEGERVYSSEKPGIAPLLDLVDRFPDGLDGAAVADRVVGGCAARVFVWLRIVQVYATVGSVAARTIMETAGVDYVCTEEIAEIRNRSQTDVCPFETLSRLHRDPRQLIEAMRHRLSEIRSGSPTGPSET